jgi:hypothetical protein
MKLMHGTLIEELNYNLKERNTNYLNTCGQDGQDIGAKLPRVGAKNTKKQRPRQDLEIPEMRYIHHSHSLFW